MKKSLMNFKRNFARQSIVMFVAILMVLICFNLLVISNASQINAAETSGWQTTTNNSYISTVDIFGGDNTTALELSSGEEIKYTVDDSNPDFKRFTFSTNSTKETVRVVDGGIDKIGAFGTEKTFVVTPDFSHVYLAKDIPVNYYIAGNKETGEVKALLIKNTGTGMNFFYSSNDGNFEVPYNNAIRDVALTDKFTPLGSDKKGKFEILLTIDDEIWGEFTFAIRNDMGEDYDKKGESHSWATVFTSDMKISGADAIMADKQAHYTMPAPPPEIDIGNGKYTYIVDVFNYDVNNIPALYDASEENGDPIPVRVEKDRIHGFYRMTLKNDKPELSLVLKNGNNISKSGAFGNGAFVVTSEYSHVYLVNGIVNTDYSSTVNPANPKITYYMNSTPSGKIKLSAIKGDDTDNLTLYYDNPSTKVSITVNEDDETSDKDSLSKIQQLVPIGEKGEEKYLFSIESPRAVAPSSKILFKATTIINKTDKNPTTLFGTGSTDNIAISIKNGSFDMPEYGSTVISTDTKWQYLDNNIDPFNSINSKLYQALDENGKISEISKFRSSWTYPTSPYTNTILDEVTNGSIDVGYVDDDWKSGVGPFAYKKSSPPVAWGKIGTILNGLINDSDKQISSYFFRYNFDLENSEKIQSAYYKLRYDDAVIIYVNGEEITRHNVPDNGYDKNLQYGSAKGLGDFDEQSGFVAIPSGLLRDEKNTISVELHQATETSSDVYLNFINFTFLQDKYIEEPAVITNINIAPGINESERNFAWSSNSKEEGLLTYWREKETPVTVKAITSKMTKKDGYTSNKVTLKDLKAGSTYYYTLSNGNIKTKTYSFKTDKDVNEFSFLMVTDSQIGKNALVEPVANAWNNTLEKAIKKWPDISFMTSSGDQIEHPDNEYQYSLYFSSPVMTKYPVATTVGSHDKNAIYLEHFNLPELTSIGGSPTGGNYSFSYGKALFISLDTNDRKKEDIDKHKQFMKDSIEAYKNEHDGQEPEWKILNFHYATYSSSIHSTDNDIRLLRAELTPAIAELDIDVSLNGHDHCYTRSLMMGGKGNANAGTVEDGRAGSKPITTGYVSSGDNKYAEYTKKKGESFYLTGNTSSLGYNPLKTTDFEYSAKSDQSERPSITLIEVTADAMIFKSYYTDVDISEDSLFDSFVLRHSVENEFNISVKSENDAVKELKGNAGKEITVEISNNGVLQNFVVHMVLYKSNGAMASYSKSYSTSELQTIKTGLIMPENIDDMTMKVFVWEAETWKPLTASTIITYELKE